METRLNNYDIIIEGTNRYYLEDLTKRDYSLEKTTPYLLKIKQNNNTYYDIKESNWSSLLKNLCIYLLNTYPTKQDIIYSFKAKWTSQVIFSKEKKVNFKPLKDHIYLNCNHTSLHLCWLIQDILTFFEINLSDVILYIHRPSSMEPIEVKKYFLEKNTNQFTLYLKEHENKNEQQCIKILDNINKYLNKLLNKISKSYDNLLLFDSLKSAKIYLYDLTTYINKNIYRDSDKIILKRYCKYLLNYYRLLSI